LTGDADNNKDGRGLSSVKLNFRFLCHYMQCIFTSGRAAPKWVAAMAGMGGRQERISRPAWSGGSGRFGAKNAASLEQLAILKGSKLSIRFNH
jgi:hypothetical protein